MHAAGLRVRFCGQFKLFNSLAPLSATRNGASIECDQPIIHSNYDIRSLIQVLIVIPLLGDLGPLAPTSAATPRSCTSTTWPPTTTGPSRSAFVVSAAREKLVRRRWAKDLLASFLALARRCAFDGSLFQLAALAPSRNAFGGGLFPLALGMSAEIAP